MGELTARVHEALALLEGTRGGAVDATTDPDALAGGWVALLEATRRVESLTQAVQLVAVARLAGTDSAVTEDGEVVEVDRGVGHVRLDASDLAASALGVTPRFAQAKVAEAVHLATHLPGVGDWLAQGLVTDYGVRTLVEQTLSLDEEQCARVVADLAPWVHDASGRRSGRVLSGSVVRGRVKASVLRTCPESLASQVEQVFGDRCLTRWSDRVGGQRWDAVLPNGEADLAWDAIDTVARGLTRDGLAATLDQARADAVVQLVLANVTTRVVLNVATPMAAPVATPAATRVATPVKTPTTATATTAATSARATPATATATPTTASATMATTAGQAGAEPAVVGVMGLASGLVEVAGAWLADVAGRASTVRREVAVDAATGWLVDPPAGGDTHDPSAALRRWVVARDGTCRFPGCDVRAGRCDLDHVIPWEPRSDNGTRHGRTESGNLLCLCRHHHRVKQRPDWSVVLHPDGTAAWTDPTGRQQVTTPVDHRAVGARPMTVDSGSDSSPADAGSALETDYACRLRRVQRAHRRTDLAQARRPHLDHGVTDDSGRPRATLGLPLADRHGIVHGDDTDDLVTGRRSQAGIRRQRDVVVEIDWASAATQGPPENERGDRSEPPPF